MFDRISDSFSGALRKLSGSGTISESNVREAMDEAAPPPRPMRKPGPPSWMKSVPGPSGFFAVWRAEMLP